MNINKLEKANNILNKIKELDAKILEIDKIAMLIANGETKSFLNLSVQDIDKALVNKDKINYGINHVHPVFSGLFESINNISHSTPLFEGVETTYETDLSENLSMQILGIILHNNQAKKIHFIEQLKKLGISE